MKQTHQIRLRCYKCSALVVGGFCYCKDKPTLPVMPPNSIATIHLPGREITPYRESRLFSLLLVLLLLVSLGIFAAFAAKASARAAERDATIEQLIDALQETEAALEAERKRKQTPKKPAPGVYRRPGDIIA